jgi:hypothetical protein
MGNTLNKSIKDIFNCKLEFTKILTSKSKLKS